MFDRKYDTNRKVNPMSYPGIFVSSLDTLLRRSLTWGLAIMAVALPLVYQSHVQPKNAARFEDDLAAQNAAAVAFDRWQREGRLHTVAGRRPFADLNVFRGDWEALSPAARACLRHRIDWGAIRGVKIQAFLIHDGEVVLAQSPREE